MDYPINGAATDGPSLEMDDLVRVEGEEVKMWREERGEDKKDVRRTQGKREEKKRK